MKKFLLNFILLITAISTAQIVDIPDPNFKAALLENGVDLNADGEIQVSEAESTYAIVADNRNITDLTGIEAFVSLSRLYISFNDLTSIDVSNNIDLVELLVEYNNLQSLDVSNNDRLIWLWFSGNNITEIDLTNNTNIQILWGSSNLLETIELSQIPDLASISLGYNDLSTLDVSDNFNLSHVSLEWGNKFTELDFSNNSLLCSLVLGGNDMLEYINLKNGENSLLVEGNTCHFGSGISNSIFIATNNPVLETICVDDVDFAEKNFINIPSQTEFIDDCLLANPAFEINSVSIFPNPTYNYVNITSEKPITEYQVYSVLGSLIYKSTSSNYTEMIDLSAYHNGIYFVRLEVEGQMNTFQIIKE